MSFACVTASLSLSMLNRIAAESGQQQHDVPSSVSAQIDFFPTQNTAFEQCLPAGDFELSPTEGSTTVPETVGDSALVCDCTIVFGLIVSEKLTLPTRAESLVIVVRAFQKRAYFSRTIFELQRLQQSRGILRGISLLQNVFSQLDNRARIPCRCVCRSRQAHTVS